VKGGQPASFGSVICRAAAANFTHHNVPNQRSMKLDILQGKLVIIFRPTIYSFMSTTNCLRVWVPWPWSTLLTAAAGGVDDSCSNERPREKQFGLYGLNFQGCHSYAQSREKNIANIDHL
jgi:hypothetical protein